MRKRLALIGSIVVAAFSCGKVEESSLDAGSPDAPHGDAGTTGDGASSIFDAQFRFDAVTVDPDVSAPDGGPPPVIDCSDAAVSCASPPSTCIDDHWLRYYQNGRCGDGGTCLFDAHDMLCPPSPTPPDCYQGGCHTIIVR
jgi:hypothetical protein